MSEETLVGSAFARLNPPVNPGQALQPVPALIEPATGAPRFWKPATDQPRPQYTAADVVAGLFKAQDPPDSDAWRVAHSHGIVTVHNEWWVPGGPSQTPPSITETLGMYLSAQWCLLYNVSAIARRKRRWAVCTTRGRAVILCGITLAERPADPGTFPKSVIGGLTFHEAEQAAIDLNRKRLEFARVPREWTVAVRLVSSIQEEEVTA